MDSKINPTRVDVAALARSGGELARTYTAGAEDATALRAAFARLWAEASDARGILSLRWTARGAWRQGGAEADFQPWLHLEASAVLPLVCQRCLDVAEVPVVVDRQFRFVADEATAAEQDDASEEDVLAIEPGFDVQALVEDELLMAVPMVPMHDTCPRPVKTRVGDAEAPAQDKPNPFAVLESLQRRN
jgi:uncharacterized protein